MSRSLKKPYGKVCQTTPGRMKLWKKKNNRKIRRRDQEIGDGNYYRRLEDVWNSPSDGNCYNGDDPKWRRK